MLTATTSMRLRSHHRDPHHPRPLPPADRGPRRAPGVRGPAAQLERGRLVEHRQPAAGERPSGGAHPGAVGAHRPLEGHLRHPQLGRAQARERAHLEPLRRGRLGQPGAHQRLGAGRPLVRRQPGGDRRRARAGGRGADPEDRGGDHVLRLRQGGRLPRLAGAEQQHLRGDRAARGARARRHACRRPPSARTSATAPMSA